MKATRISFTFVFLLLLAGITVPDIASGGGVDVFIPLEDMEEVGKTFAINVPDRELTSAELSSGGRLTLSKAGRIVEKYRWIYVNASLKNLEHAKDEARSLSNAVGGRPLVLVYLPRAVFQGRRNHYPHAFSQTMFTLLQRVLTNRQELMISAKSFGVHQTLRAINEFPDDGPLILFTGISPAFGAFGGTYDRNVVNYRHDVRDTSCKYCMIASSADIFTSKRAGGAAWRRSDGTIEGDEEVYRAMQANARNVTTVVLHGAEHEMRHYINHGLANAMRQCAEHFGMENTPAGDVVYNRSRTVPRLWAEILGPRNGSSFPVDSNTRIITEIRVKTNVPTNNNEDDYRNVNFFVNDIGVGSVERREVSQRTNQEYRFRLRPSHLPPPGPGRDECTYQIRAVAWHGSGQRVSTESININIRDDRPYVIFKKPRSSSVTTYRDYDIVEIEAEIVNLDPAAIEKVRFQIDGKRKADDTTPPYSYQWHARYRSRPGSRVTRTLQVIAFRNSQTSPLSAVKAMEVFHSERWRPDRLKPTRRIVPDDDSRPTVPKKKSIGPKFH